MSGIAEVLLNLGYPVSGSDLRESDVTRRLASLGAGISIGHRAENVARADVVVVSSAVRRRQPRGGGRARPRHPGDPARRDAGRADAGQGRRRRRRQPRQDDDHDDDRRRSWPRRGWTRPPSSAARRAPSARTRAWGRGEILVAEADESDGSFRHLFPTVAVVTNIDREHLDHFGSEEALDAAFFDFADKVPFYGLVVMGADNPAAARLAPRLRSATSPTACRGRLARRDPRGGARAARASASRVRGKRARRSAGPHARRPLRRECAGGAVRGRLPGRAVHRLRARRWRSSRASTAASRCAARRAASWSSTTTVTTRPSWRRPSRRRAFTAGGWSSRSSRTASRARAICWHDFAPALAGADEVVLTDIYAAGEPPIAGVTRRRCWRPSPAAHARATCARRLAAAWPSWRARAIWCCAWAPATSPTCRRAAGAARQAKERLS